MEQRHLDVLERVKDAVTVPVAVKLSPYFSSIGEMALRLDEAGADGLVLFNRFLQPDIDPEELAVVPQVELSSPADGRAAADLDRAAARAGARRRSPAPAASRPQPTWRKYLLAGADVVMTASALLRHGPDHAGALVDGLSAWMGRKGFDSVEEFRGMLAVTDGDEAGYERAGYVSPMREANASAEGAW